MTWQVAMPHGVAVPQVPLGVHVATLLLLAPVHSLCPGAHEPWQPPPTQAWLMQAFVPVHADSVPSG